MRLLTNRSALLLQLTAGLCAGVVAIAQETDSGDLAPSSTGQIVMSLEITNRPNPTLSLTNRRGSIASIPQFVEERLLPALTGRNNFNFPLCLAGTGGNEVTVIAQSSDDGTQFLLSDDGSKIPFGVTVKGNAANQLADRKTQYRRSDDIDCNADSALEVTITISEQQNQPGWTTLRGQFNLIITSE